jgi:hypothetical protein
LFAILTSTGVEKVKMSDHASESKAEKQRTPVSSNTQLPSPFNQLSELPSALTSIHRKSADPRRNLTVQELRTLQRTVGNQAVQRMLAGSGSLQRRVMNPDELPSMPSDALHRHHVLDFITIKLIGRGIDHWWIEIDDSESYGWWPVRDAEDAGDAARNFGIAGVAGELNAVSRPALGGTRTRDPHHGDSASESFHPYTIDSSDTYSDDEIKRKIRVFANAFSGDYRILFGPNCHTFITDMMRRVGLSMGNTSGTEPILP